MKFENVYFTTPNKTSFGKKGFKYFTGYKDGDEVTSWCIMLPKMRLDMEKVLMKLNMCLFWSNMINCLRNMIKSDFMSAVLLKKNLIANQFTMKNN